MIRYKFSKSFIKFCVVGSIGFFVEAIIIETIKHLIPSFLVYVRLLSFPTALLITWALNRMFVFESKKSRTKEIIKYTIVQSTGAFLNIAIYTVLLITNSFFREYPLIALGIGSGVALISNYTLSKSWVFK